MPGRKNPMTVNLVANPYPAPKAIVSDITICEICDNRLIKTKDWNAHKGSKKHRLNEDTLRGKDNDNKGGLANHFNSTFNSTDTAGGWGSPAFVEASNDGNRANTSNFNGACYGCGEQGHSKRDCPVRSGNRGCFNCGENGHTKAECTNPRQGGGGGSGACYRCGEQGHNKANCPSSSGAGSGGGGNCHNCGNPGHRKADCSEPRVMTCRNCDGKGHISRECPKPKDWSKHKCSNCGNFGHGPKRCTEPPKENDSGSGGGGGGWDTGVSSAPTGDAPTGDWNKENDSQAQGGWADDNAAGAGAVEEGAALW